MNKMRKAIQSLQAMLAMLALVCVSLVSFTACSDDDEPVSEVTYSWGFADLSASTPDFLDDIHKIESTFKAALGATDEATYVTRQGTPEQCDQEVREACQQAFNSLKDEVWQGRYTFTVTNVTTGTVIFSHTFDADNENSGKSYTASDLKPGDYYYSDGTWSDGGLRSTNADGTMEWAEPRPEPLSGKTVIGMVFQAGHHPNDESDYSATGIGQAECRGYAVALQDANDSYCKWGREDIVLGLYPKDADGNAQNNFSYPQTDWSGYGYTQAIISDAGGKNKLDAEELDGYPATYYAVVKYETSCPAPVGSSGWFLPSIGQLLTVCQLKDDLFGSTESSSFKAEDYWSSSESYLYPETRVLRVLVDYSGIGNDYGFSSVVGFMGKDYFSGRPIYVRPVLAF